MSVQTPETVVPDREPFEPKAVPSLSQLFLAFLSLGATAFGGPAMVAYIRDLAVKRKGWLDARTFDEGVALCQTVPGATAMQTAAYVGLRLRGVAGAAVSYVGFGLPAFGLMWGLSAAYSRTHSLPAVVSVFSGLQAIVVAIVANAAVAFGKTTLKHWRHVPITALAVALYACGLSPFLVIVLASLLACWLLSDQTPAASQDGVPAPMGPTTRAVVVMLGATAVVLASLFLLDRQLGLLATLMLRIDLFAFGGGFASVPLLFNEVVHVRQWLDAPTLLDGIVLGQVTPGPIVITATFVGCLLRGLLGEVVATVAVFWPSFLIVVAAAPHFDRLRASAGFRRLIEGALCTFPGLLLIVTVQFAQGVRWDVPHSLLAAVAFGALRLGADLLWVVLIGGGLALLFGR
jgi:chromate transporter